VQALLFGAGHEALASRRVATLQTVGSSGGLKVGADFIKRWLPDSQVWVSDPTWDNHRAMFEGAGVTVNTYPYYDAATGGLPSTPCWRCSARCRAQRGAAARLLPQPHRRGPDARAVGRADPAAADRGCCPTWTWPTRATATASTRTLLCRARAGRRGLTFFVANSFSKSMSVYGERAGALSVVCADAAEAELVLGQLKATVRRNYSSPPSTPQASSPRAVRPALRASWEADVPRCASASLAMRRSLHGVLSARCRARLRLLPQPARHVQLHRPERRPGGPAARRVCRLPGALGPHVRGRAEHRQRRTHRSSSATWRLLAENLTTIHGSDISVNPILVST
jgi:aromatic-amino-acid transaminase